MQEDKIQASIMKFYSNNHINYEKYTDDMDIHFQEGLDVDKRIYKPRLEHALDEWLDNFEEDDKAYYLKLFEHFTYFTQRNFEYIVYCLKETVFEILSRYPQDKIMIIFAESKKGFKSGASEMAAAWWKACNGQMRKSQLIEMFSKTAVEEVAEMDAVVFVDDIVATGVTLSKAIEEFFEKFPYSGFTHTDFFATGVIAAKRGKRKIIGKCREKGIDIEWIYGGEHIAKVFHKEYASEAFKGGYITQAFKGGYIFGPSEKKEIEDAVLKYEEKIGIDDDGKSYVMGYGKSKLLVGFHYEIPNNTLCTFWRNGESHIPLFERSGNQRITLQEIRKRKHKMRDNAYKMKSVGGKR